MDVLNHTLTNHIKLGRGKVSREHYHNAYTGSNLTINDKTCHTMNKDNTGLRFCGYANEIIRLNHTGWYTDHYQDNVLKGLVWQLPAKRGVERFIVGYESTDFGGVILDFSRVYDDKEEAARMADEYARVDAEEVREYYIKDDAKYQIESNLEELGQLRLQVKRCIVDVRNGALTACDYLKVLLKQRIKLWKRINQLKENPWVVAE